MKILVSLFTISALSISGSFSQIPLTKSHRIELIYITLDSSNNVVKKEVDQGGDGTINAIYKNKFNTSGNLTQEYVDNDGDGLPSSILNFYYDSSGNKTKEEHDRDGDGYSERIYFYDLNKNNEIEQEVCVHNGSPEYRYSYIFKDKKITKEIFYLSPFKNPNQTTFFFYDSFGNVTKKIVDFYSESDFDKIYTYEFDKQNRMIQETYDHNGDGFPERTEAYTYDTKNNSKKICYYKNDDSSFYAYTVFYYDSLQRIIKRQSYSKERGQLIRTQQEYYGQNGVLIKSTIDYNSDGKPETIWLYHHDLKGQLIQSEYDKNGDGNPENIKKYIYLK